MIHELEAMLQEVGKFTEKSAKAAEAHEHTAIAILIVLAVVSIVIGLVFSWFFSEALIKGVRKAIVTASGDLTAEIEIDSKDEIGELLTAMNGMRGRLLDMVASMADFSHWIVKTTDLTELDVVEIDEGQTVKVTLDALPDNSMTGEVQSIGQNYSERQGDVVYEVTVVLTETQPNIRWGMTAKVEFIK